MNRKKELLWSLRVISSRPFLLDIFLGVGGLN